MKGGFFVQYDIAALSRQKLRHLIQSAARTLQRPTVGGGVVFAKKRNVTELGSHSQITSLK
jgi:hypothetical protein